MRVTAKTKAATRLRIVDVARAAFTAEGWERTTTRALASRAGIASGTFFNYFSTKDAVARELLGAALHEAADEFRRRRPGDASLEEDLFGYIWSGLRHLEPYRSGLGPMLPWLLSRSGGESALADAHVRAVDAIVTQHGLALTSVLQELYWTLYLGVVARWAADDSPHQEQTLALLDQSLILFSSAIEVRPSSA